MSKSLGNVLDPFAVIDRFGSDALRYYLLRDVSFGQDGSVSAGAFEERYERELANDYGNLASRTLAMIGRYRDGQAPDVRHDPALDEDFDGLADDASSELLDRAEVTQALEEIWQRVRRLNRYVEERAPWKLAKDEAPPGELDVVLATLAEGLRVLTVLLQPWLPGDAERLLAALGTPDVALEAAQLGARRVGARRSRSSRCSPSSRRTRRRVIDSHTHLDSCEPPNAELLAAARGRRRAPDPHGRDGRRACRSATMAAERFPEVYVAVGRHPNPAEGFDDRVDRAAARVRRARALPGDRRDGPGLLPRPRAAGRPAAGLRRADRARARARQAARDPLARGRGRDARDAARARRRRARDPALLLDARPARRVPRAAAAGGSRSRGTSPTRAPAIWPPRPSASPTTGCSSRPTRRTSRRRPCASERNQPAFVVHTARFLAERRGVDVRRARGRGRAQRGASSSAGEGGGARTGDGRAARAHAAEPAAHARARRAPRRDLGQNFLVDSNILGVIERLAELEPADVVLEIGGGLGVLSEHLAPRCAHVHVVEIDRRSCPPSRRRSAPRANTTLARRRRDGARPRGARPARRRRSSRTCPTASRRARSCARSRSCRR